MLLMQFPHLLLYDVLRRDTRVLHVNEKKAQMTMHLSLLISIFYFWLLPNTLIILCFTMP